MNVTHRRGRESEMKLLILARQKQKDVGCKAASRQTLEVFQGHALSSSYRAGLPHLCPNKLSCASFPTLFRLLTISVLGEQLVIVQRAS